MNTTQKSLYYALIIIVLIITDVTLFSKNRSLSEEIIIKDQIITEQAQLLQLTDDLKLNLKANYIYGQNDLAKVIVEDSVGSKHYISDIINETCLIFHYDLNNCKECISFAANELSKINNIDIPIIIIISGIGDYNKQYIYSDTYYIGAPIYTIDTALLSDIDINVPYYCITDSNSTIRNIFIPNKLFPKNTDSFISIAKQIIPSKNRP